MLCHRLTQHKVSQTLINDVINLSDTHGNFSMAGFFDDVSSNVEYRRSYRCNAENSYKFKNLTDTELVVSINVVNFQVQAFEFKDNKVQFGNGEFFYRYIHVN